MAKWRGALVGALACWATLASAQSSLTDPMVSMPEVLRTLKVPTEKVAHRQSLPNYYDMKYEATHKPGVLSLDNAQGLSTVMCSEDSLRLTFESSEQAKDFVQAIMEIQGSGLTTKLVGHTHHGCLNPKTQKPATIVRKATGAETNEMEVVVSTEPAAITDVLSQATVSLSGTPLPEADRSMAEHWPHHHIHIHKPHIHIPIPAKVPAIEKKIHKAIKHAGHEAHKEEHKWIDPYIGHHHDQSSPGGCNAADMVKGTCTADIKCSHDLPGWSVDMSGKVLWSAHNKAKTVEASVTCSDCSFHYVPTVTFELQIVDDKIANISISLRGHMDLTIMLDVHANGEFTHTYSKLLAEIIPHDISFHVGSFPFAVHFAVPIEAGASLDATASGTVTTGYSASATAQAGIALAKGKPENIGYYAWKQTFHKPTYSTHGEVKVHGWVRPSAKIEVSDIGNYQVDISADLNIDANAGKATGGKVNYDVLATGELSTTGKGDLNITIDHKHILKNTPIKEKSFFDKKFPIFHTSSGVTRDFDALPAPSTMIAESLRDYHSVMTPAAHQFVQVPTSKVYHVMRRAGASLDGRNQTEISATVQHKPGVVSIDFAEGAYRVRCMASGDVEVDFNSESSAQNVLDILNEREVSTLVAHPAWGCRNPETLKTTALLKRVRKGTGRVQAFPHTSNTEGDFTSPVATLTIPAEDAKMGDVLASTSVNADLAMGGLTSSSTSHSCTVKHIIEGKCSVQFICRHQFESWGYNFDGKQLEKLGPFTVNCVACHLELTPTITFGLDIHDDHIHNASVIVTADLDVQAEMTAGATEKYSKDFTKQLFVLKPDSFVFMIGVFPVTVDISIPIKAGAHFEADATATVTAGAGAHGHFVGGFVYQHGFHSIHTATFTHHYTKPTYKVAAHADVGAIMEADVNLEFEHFVTMGVTARAEADVPLSWDLFHKEVDAGSVTGKCNVAAKGVLQLDLDGHSIGGKKEFGPYPIYSWSEVLWRWKTKKSE